MTPFRALIPAALAALVPLHAGAQQLTLPDQARIAGEKVERLASYQVPLGPWSDGGLQTVRAEGAVVQRAWQFPLNGRTTLEIMAPLRTQLVDMGYEPLFQCEADVCGGFDFRYAVRVLPEPMMHVDLGDFRFLAARRDGDDGAEYAAILVSRSSTQGFVHVVRVGAATIAAPAATVSTKTPRPQGTPAGPGMLSDPVALGHVLETRGRAVLDDLTFATGSSTLGSDMFASLSELADYLLDNPGRKVALVGHTDAEGALEGNIVLSRRRAQSVRDRLVNEFGVPAAQLSARGVGYLVPLDSNLTEQGRRANRRVEVVLTSTR